MPHDFRDRPVAPPIASKALRTRCVSTKLTEEEYATCAELASSKTLSEWAREVLLSSGKRRPIEELLLAEVLALRTILINFQFVVATQGAPTADQMQGLIDRADREKAQKAAERLMAARHP
jgi:hypothetical protein